MHIRNVLAGSPACPFNAFQCPASQATRGWARLWEGWVVVIPFFKVLQRDILVNFCGDIMVKLWNSGGIPEKFVEILEERVKQEEIHKNT